MRFVIFIDLQVLKDPSATKETLKMRAMAMKKLGTIFQVSVFHCMEFKLFSSVLHHIHLEDDSSLNLVN